MNSVDAKLFLISRVTEEAGFEQVSLSPVEKKMLHFTEVHPTLPDIYEVNAQFERECDANEYEVKVAGLLKRARERDGHESPSRAQQWEDALSALSKEDHYILVMVGQAFGSSWSKSEGTRRRLRDLLLYAAIAVGLVLLLFVWSTYRR
jgi:uncharacterized protein YjiK